MYWYTIWTSAAATVWKDALLTLLIKYTFQNDPFASLPAQLFGRLAIWLLGCLPAWLAAISATAEQ